MPGGSNGKQDVHRATHSYAAAVSEGRRGRSGAAADRKGGQVAVEEARVC
jgi:hypothetical protein